MKQDGDSMCPSEGTCGFGFFVVLDVHTYCVLETLQGEELKNHNAS